MLERKAAEKAEAKRRKAEKKEEKRLEKERKAKEKAEKERILAREGRGRAARTGDRCGASEVERTRGRGSWSGNASRPSGWRLSGSRLRGWRRNEWKRSD